MSERQTASLRPARRALRWWVGLAALVLVAAVGLVWARPAPGRPLDPGSPAKDGTRALATLLADRGTTSRALTSLADAVGAADSATVIITSPDDFSTGQLQRLRQSSHRLVAVDPDPRALDALAPGRTERADDASSAAPDCDWAGASAAGTIEFPGRTQQYSGDGGCYGGVVVVTPRLVLLGTADVLTNRYLGDGHRAALAVNALSDDGASTELVWLLPGADASGPGAPTVWSLFPPWAGRAVWQLALVGLLVALWRGRRLGPVVSEPLPVVVHAAEIVEGHGRLYRRSRDRERAAAALREGTARRLATRLHLPSTATAEQVATTMGARAVALRPAPPPADDDALVRVAQELRDLENDTNGAAR